MTKQIIFKGQEVELDGWAHQSNNLKGEKIMDAYKNWVELQNEIYNTKEKNIYSHILNLSKLLDHPISDNEALSISLNIEPYSAVPILEEVSKYHCQNNPLNPVLLYLGGGTDTEHSSLFFPKTSIFVDYSPEYSSIDKSMAKYFKNLEYNVYSVAKSDYSVLNLEKNKLSKNLIFIRNDIKNSDEIKEILSENDINYIDFLVQKKVSGHPECPLNYLDLLSKQGLFLYSDINVYKSIPGMSQIWHGELYSTTLQSDSDPETYPAKLFRKE